jgi:hypothetical protein
MQEAAKTAEPERQRRGELSGFITFAGLTAAGTVAGVVDDALLGTATAMGAPNVIMDQYDGFAGPTQQAVGSAWRSLQDWSWKNLW